MYEMDVCRQFVLPSSKNSLKARCQRCEEAYEMLGLAKRCRMIGDFDTIKKDRA